jgi:thiol-disulfide isomerase/thioredoxin
MMTKRGSRARIAGWILAIVAAQGLALFVYFSVERARSLRRQDGEFQHERVAGRTAPDLILARPDGSTRRLVNLRGRPVLLHFWATWCPPCLEELPALLELGRTFGESSRLTVVAVAVDDDWEALRRFFGGEIPPEVYRDSSGYAARA